MVNRLTEIFEALGGNTDDPHEVLHLKNSAEKQKLIRRLIDERKRQGLTQKELGSRMRVSQEAVCRFESLGGDPRVSTIMRYATALGQRIEIRNLPMEDELGQTERLIPLPHLRNREKDILSRMETEFRAKVTSRLHNLDAHAEVLR